MQKNKPKITVKTAIISLITLPSSLYIFGFFPAPYYIFFLLGLVLFFCNSDLFVYDIKTLVILIMTLVYFIVFQFTDSTLNVWSYYTLGIFTCLFIVTVRKSFDQKEVTSVSIGTCVSYLLVYSVDTIFRYLNPRQNYFDYVATSGNDDVLFYAYKHSYIFQDSNFVGLSLISVFFLLLNLKQPLGRYYKPLLAWCFLLTVLTISRASIFVLVLVWVLKLFFDARFDIRIKLAFLIFSTSIIVLFVYGLNSIFVADDVSLETKFLIVKLFISQLEDNSIYSNLFGWGLNQTYYYWGIAAHNLFITLILETGIIGFLIVILLFLYFFELNREVIYQLLAFIVASQSFGLLFTPMLIPIALNIILRNNGNR
ncbi:hypothetical protein AB4345_04730 [Vibrio breoganii]